MAGTEDDDVLYADDAICLAHTVAAMNRILGASEKEGEKYGMTLNKKRCEYVAFGGAGPVRFPDGRKLHPEEEAQYLCAYLNSKACPGKEVGKGAGVHGDHEQDAHVLQELIQQCKTETDSVECQTQVKAHVRIRNRIHEQICA